MTYVPRHRRTSRPWGIFALLGAALAVILGLLFTFPLSGPAAVPVAAVADARPAVPPRAPHREPVPGAYRDYRVRPGDTLWAIAGSFCGNPRDWIDLARASHLADPSVLYAGEVLKIACPSLRVLRSSAPGAKA